MKMIIRTEFLGKKAQTTLEDVSGSLDKIEGRISFLNCIALSQLFFLNLTAGKEARHRLCGAQLEEAT